MSGVLFNQSDALLKMPVRPLPPILAEKAKKELFEDPHRLNNDIQHIKDWIAKQPHLNARTDDQWIVIFLRGCKFSLERTKEKIDLYYTLRKAAPELNSVKHTEPIFDELFNLGTIIPLPKSEAPDAPQVTIVRLGRMDPEKYNICDVISISFLLNKINLMENDNVVICGTITIMDLADVTMAHLLQFKPIILKKMIAAGQDALPIRMKGTHFLNTPPGFEAVFNVAKGMLNEKNKNRIYVHNKNYEELYKHVSQKILPEEYGGNGGTIEEILNKWKQKINEFDSFLEEDYKYGTDESKRPGKPKTEESMFGTEGSFRQLNFD